MWKGWIASAAERCAVSSWAAASPARTPQGLRSPRRLGAGPGVTVRKLPFSGGLDRYVVAQNGAQIVEVAFFVGHGDQPPVAVSGGDFDSEDRGRLIIGEGDRLRRAANVADALDGGIPGEQGTSGHGD